MSKKEFSVFIPHSPKFKEMPDRDFELYNEDEIDGYLDKFYKGKLHIRDNFELCCLYDNVDRPKYSVYLAFYDDKLYWTLNKHNGKRVDDYENKYTFEWVGEGLNKDNLYAAAKKVLTVLVDNYEKVQRGLKCL